TIITSVVPSGRIPPKFFSADLCIMTLSGTVSTTSFCSRLSSPMVDATALLYVVFTRNIAWVELIAPVTVRAPRIMPKASKKMTPIAMIFPVVQPEDGGGVEVVLELGGVGCVMTVSNISHNQDARISNTTINYYAAFASEAPCCWLHIRRYVGEVSSS